MVVPDFLKQRLSRHDEPILSWDVRPFPSFLTAGNDVFLLLLKTRQRGKVLLFDFESYTAIVAARHSQGLDRRAPYGVTPVEEIFTGEE